MSNPEDRTPGGWSLEKIRGDVIKIIKKRIKEGVLMRIIKRKELLYGWWSRQKVVVVVVLGGILWRMREIRILDELNGNIRKKQEKKLLIPSWTAWVDRILFSALRIVKWVLLGSKILQFLIKVALYSHFFGIYSTCFNSKIHKIPYQQPKLLKIY